MARKFTGKTFLDLIRDRVSESPDAILYHVMKDGEARWRGRTWEGAVETMTFGQLDTLARAISVALLEFASCGDRALLLYPPGAEYIAAFYGCLYAGIVPVPLYPPDTSRLVRDIPRFEAVARSARPALILTTAAIAETARDFQRMNDLAPRILATDTIEASRAEEWREPAIDASDVVFLQYTSGSTGNPKGVMLSHRNLLSNLELIRRSFGHHEGSRGVIWLPPYHDMGLIGGILQPAYAGFPVTLMSPWHFVRRPLRWVRAISEFGGTVSGGPSFAYDLCARKVVDADVDRLDLSTWTVAFNGAENVSAESIDRFCAKFERAGFRRSSFFPCYGLAECTLIVTGGLAAEEPKLHEFAATGSDPCRGAKVLVGCGRPLAGCRVEIIDPATKERQRSGKVGEIWVSGPSVAHAYWENEEASGATFGAKLADDDDVFCRTGDLGFLDAEGELFVVGRIKDVIKANGRNIYPQDIEATIQDAHVAIRRGACAAFSMAATQRVGVAVELSSPASPKASLHRHRDGESTANPSYEDIARAISVAVWQEFGISTAMIALLRAGNMPKTSSGKLQRFACRDALENGTLDPLFVLSSAAHQGESI